MLRLGRLCFALLVFAALCFATAPARAGAVQLTTAAQLDPLDVSASYPAGTPIPGQSASTLPNPLVIGAGGNVLTFSKPTGLFVVNSFFGPGTLSTGNAFGQFGAPVTIAFQTGVTEFGFLARPNFSGPPGFAFTFTAFNGAAPLGTFSVGTSGAISSLFLGARATDADVITSLVVNHTIPDFAIGPVTFGTSQAAAPVPEPATMTLVGTGLIGAAGVAARRRRRAGPE